MARHALIRRSATGRGCRAQDVIPHCVMKVCRRTRRSLENLPCTLRAIASRGAKIALPATAVVLVTGCTHLNGNSGESALWPGSSRGESTLATAMNLECGPDGTLVESKHYLQNKTGRVAEIKVNATGYGAPPKAFYPEPQRRLMAMRAAKVDAYRSLAERVNGLRISGGTTIGDMVVEKDRYRVFLDAYVAGAVVIAENPIEDGTYETIVELKVGQDFLRKALNGSMPANDPCAKPVRNAPKTGTQAMTATAVAQPVVDKPTSSFYFGGEGK